MTWLTNIWNTAREVWSFRHEPEHFRKLADFYWRALLVLAALTIMGFAAYGMMKFMDSLTANEDLLVASGTGVPLLNQRDLQATLEGFEARRARYEALKVSTPNIADPSR